MSSLTDPAPALPPEHQLVCGHGFFMFLHSRARRGGLSMDKTSASGHELSLVERRLPAICQHLTVVSEASSESQDLEPDLVKGT